MRGWRRVLAYLGVIVVVALVYYIGSGAGGDSGADALSSVADPGYGARDAEIIETGHDGLERYRLKAAVISQQTDSGVIDLENLQMNYHVGAKDAPPGAAAAQGAGERWHLTSDRGQVRADGDDVQLDGNVRVTGLAPGSGAPLSLTTETMRINTPTEFIETDAQVLLRWPGYEISARGMQADLKAGTLRLESDVNGRFVAK